MALDFKKIQQALLVEDNKKYDEISKLAATGLRLSYFSIERIYISKSEYESLATCGQYDKEKSRRTYYSISALGHPSLGRVCVLADEVPPDINDDLNSLAAIIGKQFQIDWMRNLMGTLSQPIPWEDNESKYLERLAETCRKAAAAAHIAIREKRHNSLFAVAWNSRDQLVDFQPIISLDSSSQVAKAIFPFREEDRIPFHGPQSEVVQHMRSKLAHDFLRVIISMPIIIQGERIGVINFAYDHEFKFSETFRSGLELLANTIGTALANYRLRSTIEVNARKIFWSGRQALNYELMQGYRHWAGSSLFKLDGAIDNLVDAVSDLGDPETAEKYGGKIDASRDELHRALESMEDLTKNYKLSATTTSLREVFVSCERMLSYDLSRTNISVVRPTVFDRLVGNEDALRAVFLNLMLNSIQACSGSTQKEGKITLSLSMANDVVEFVYSDDGPGIRLGPKLRKVEDVWLPEVTTKDTGTGFGMPMVRQVIEKLHGGKIHLNVKKRQRGFSVSGHIPVRGYSEGGL
ncbi:ATP-binding protein [Roseobacteraceae bacterium S113]